MLDLPGETTSIVVVIDLFTFSISHRPQLERTVNEWIHNTVRHAKEENDRLQVFAQLQ